MPEIKNQFTGGKMNKDLDERLVPKGEYRDAMNIQVSTSEGSDVGTIQNILGNRQVTLQDGFVLPNDSTTIGCVSDEKNDTLYYLICSDSTNYIISYTKDNSFGLPIFVDHNNVLQFQKYIYITGINIIDDMLLWTDNKTEPKKINITRCKLGTPNFVQHTRLINDIQAINFGSAVNIETKHITVIKKAPKTALKLKLNTSRDPDKIYTGVITTTKGPNISPATTNSLGVPNTQNESSFVGSAGYSSSNENFRYDFGGITTEEGSNIFSVHITNGVDSTGAVVPLGPINAPDGWGSGLLPGLQGWHHNNNPTYGGSPSGQASNTNIDIGTKVVLKPFNDDGSIPSLPVTDYVIKGEVVDRWNENTLYPLSITSSQSVDIKVTAIDGFPPVATEDQLELKYVIDLFDDNERLFEFKFPRFSYRYKYSDGEYSTFAPWTQVAFEPGSFDYHPRKGYNLGMTNRIKDIDLHGLVTEKTPKDVISVDILFKDEPSPNIYVVDTIRKDDDDGIANPWNDILTNDVNGGFYKIEKETINAVVPSNQLLRPWDNVPRKALAQDVTGNRVVYGNYIQNYDLKLLEGGKYIPKFNVDFVEFPESIITNTPDLNGINTRVSGAGKSIKSLREYQLGVVFTDKYGRETPVISNESGTIKLEKKHADKYNRLNATLDGNYPMSANNDLQYFKFYIKETSGEYYNMAMDRWYDAEDGNIWLAFPSSDRNKVDIDSFLILKKGSDLSELVADPARYKVIAIENEAPDYIKTKRTLATKITHGSQTDIFGTVIGDGPAQGRRQFELNYGAFFGTAAMHLDNYAEGELWFELSDASTGQASNRYKIASIEHDHDKDISGVPVTLTNAKYYISLEEDLGNDVNFVTNDPTGVNSNSFTAGTQVNIYKYEIKNSPKFDGRFFVKIYSDDVFSDNIGKSYLEGLDYRVLNSKKVYYMHPDHRKMHTEDLNNFLTYGDSSLMRGDVVNEYPQNGNNWVGTSFTLTDGFDKWGYYSVPEFASMALYFRRYSQVEQDGPDGNKSTQIGLGIDRYQLLPHLKPGSTTTIASGSVAPWGSASNDLVTYLGSGEYSDDWTPARNWKNEHGRCKMQPGISGNDVGLKGYTTSFRVIQNFNGKYLLEKEVLDADNARDTEVWFIDGGPYAGKCWDIDNNLNFGNMGRWEKNRDGTTIGNPNSYYAGTDQNMTLPQGFTQAWDFQAGNNTGMSNNVNNDTHKMELAFGGIRTQEPASPGTSNNHFNLGNWDQGSGTLNSYYNDLTPFIKNINSGIKFRWKQDPTGQTYVIGSATRQNVLRHSTTRGNDSSIEYPNVIASQPGFTSNTIGLEYNLGASMAELLSFNYSKNWRTSSVSPSYINRWDPLTDGEINGPNIGGMVIHLVCCDANGATSGSGQTAFGIDIQSDLVIHVTSLVGNPSNAPALDTYSASTLMVGMALESYEKRDDATGTLSSVTSQLGGEDYLVIRRIDEITTSNYKLYLGGYKKPLLQADHELANTSSKRPKIGSNFRFVQVGMNGYSHNSEFNINTMAKNHPTVGDRYGAITAVGFDLEFIEYIEPEEILSENPAIWETEPKTEEGLDVYYEASASIPMETTADTIESAFPINTSFLAIGGFLQFYKLDVVGYLGSQLIVKDRWGTANTAQTYTGVTTLVGCSRPDGIDFQPTFVSIVDTFFPTTGTNLHGLLTVSSSLYNISYKLDWHNCYSFGNGVESNRIRDNFNLPFIVNGVKVSTTLEHDYKEEHRKYGLIYSGIYNSTSGVNNLNQFIQAEKITKDVNPIYGSIQKLHSRDSDLVTLCEDKILRILANKDAVFNADGNTNLTATANVLGQTIPFSGEYGISTNPESFASEAYRAYFSDQVRGRVMRLSKDGLTPISDYGMKDWFKDNLKLANIVSGSYDDKKDEYNITLRNIPQGLPISIVGHDANIPEDPGGHDDGPTGTSL